MNVYLQEFKMRFKSVLTWSVAAVVVMLVFLSLFSSFAAQTASVNDLLSKYPPQLLDAFGLNGVDLSTVLGFFGMVFLFVQLCLAIQAANYGFSLVSVEEREWTADFLLTKPMKRSRILTGKILAALTGLTITNAFVWVGSFVFLAIFRAGKPYSVPALVLLLLSIVVFQLFFFCVGLIISLIVKRIRNVIPYAVGLGLGMYMLSAFGKMLGTSILEKITPFSHFDANYILQHQAWDAPLALVSAGVIILATISSYVLYIRRDVSAVN